MEEETSFKVKQTVLIILLEGRWGWGGGGIPYVVNFYWSSVTNFMIQIQFKIILITIREICTNLLVELIS
jgi:hypothetical protein